MWKKKNEKDNVFVRIDNLLYFIGIGSLIIHSSFLLKMSGKLEQVQQFDFFTLTLNIFLFVTWITVATYLDVTLFCVILCLFFPSTSSVLAD